MENITEIIEQSLINYLPSKNCREKRLIEAMEYSLSAGGKRIRPMLTVEFCKLCEGSVDMAIPFACAVECIHTYSLIHDDLPCMDDDDIRRGKPSNHKIFGESTALLAGDALQSLAFNIASSPTTVSLVGACNTIKAINILSELCGVSGMVGGQQIDLEHENKNADINILRDMDNKKTGALIAAACQMGCVAAGAGDNEIKYAKIYGENIGLAFQIMDDILDVTADESVFGKPTGSDEMNNKSTYVSLLGIDECRNMVNTLTARAIESLSFFKGNVLGLQKFAVDLANRNK